MAKKRKSKQSKKEEDIQEHLFEVKIIYYAGLADTTYRFLIAVPQPTREPPSFEQAIENVRSVIEADRRDDKDAWKNDRMLNVEYVGVINN